SSSTMCTPERISPAMRSSRNFAAIFGLVAAVTAGCTAAGCTGAAPPKPDVPANPDQPQKIADGDQHAVDDDALDVDVQPVKAPGEVVLHLRWANPSASAATVAGYAHMPASQIQEA